MVERPLGADWCDPLAAHQLFDERLLGGWAKRRRRRRRCAPVLFLRRKEEEDEFLSHPFLLT
ncbi:unnamed protein product [Malus baccata var. baccata]